MGDHADALYLRAVDEIDEIREMWADESLRASVAIECLCPSDWDWQTHTPRGCPIHGIRLEAIAYRQEQLAEADASYHADSERDA